MDYVRLGLVNKPNKTIKIRVVAVCDAGVSGGLGLGSFWSGATQRKMGVNERASSVGVLAQGRKCDC